MHILKTDDARHPDNILSLTPKIETDLYVEGEIKYEDKNSVAIVGTRKMSLYGAETAYKVGKACAENNITVVSGLARGIDTESHRAALEFGGRTIAVVGTGIDKIYPEENIMLAKKIKENGALISQFPLGTPPLKRNFPLRNKTVALLSSTLVVIEAPAKSGSLITASYALWAGKEIYVVPGEVDNNSFAGNLKFIEKNLAKENVHILSSLTDFIKEILQKKTIKSKPAEICKKIDFKDEDEEKIYNILKKEKDGLFFDTVAERTGLEISVLSLKLFDLTLRGIVKEINGKIYKISEE